jgi:hypothetical protein
MIKHFLYLCILLNLLALSQQTSWRNGTLKPKNFGVWWRYDPFFIENSRENMYKLVLETINKREEEKRNKIYREMLASKVKGPVLRDFLTIRY